jgi:hypothetical protein
MGWEWPGFIMYAKLRFRRASAVDHSSCTGRRDEYEVMEAAPRRRKERRKAEGGARWRDAVYLSERGSLL